MKKILDWDEYSKVARQVIREGCILLENKDNTLPLKKDTCVSIFGRIQNNYYKSGTGSGGMVNVSKVYNIVEGLELSGHVTINQNLQKIYADWEKTHPIDEGFGWGQEPWSQAEMPLTKEIVDAANKESDVAIVIIGRTAGEDKDASNTPGSYLLTNIENEMLALVRGAFSKMIVLLNVGSIIDMSFVDQYSPDAVMYVWQGGMLGGLGTADVLIGESCPSGKLTDTIAYELSDYPSSENFGDAKKNFYCEDIYVGYRYFETFAKDRVRYPFGYGLSYTTFSMEKEAIDYSAKDQLVTVSIKVTNTGTVAGKEVAQLYIKSPQGKLGKPDKELLNFAKTGELKPGQSEVILFSIPYLQFASFDDSGVTGHANCFVLEEGKYEVLVGANVRDTTVIGSQTVSELIVLKKCEEALAPVEGFDRIKPVLNADGTYEIAKEPVPVATIDMDERRAQRIPKELPQTDTTYQLRDVLNGVIPMDTFIAQLSDDDLSCIIRGEGMGSSRVTPGTAAAFGGVSDRLTDVFGIPAVCCDDGPSGMRLDCGLKAFSLPNGFMMGSTFNADLLEALYSFTALEMITNNVECLLGPGMNIHRHPLNGRNFEYFSEDPYVTGVLAVAQLKGLRKNGVTGTIKHFCGNNQEYNRRDSDSIISTRALREIYLHGFDLAVCSGIANSVMTTYGSVNGLFTAGSYDLNTTILREDWGFKGIVMTDWWADISERNQPKNKTNFAAMIRSQNDLYMVCPDGSTNASGDNTLQALAEGKVTRAELQRSAANICEFVMHTEAMKRLLGTNTEVEIINRPKDDSDFDLSDLEYITLDGELTIDLTTKESKANTNYVFALDTEKPGTYQLELTGSSTLTELAQMPCTMFYSNFPVLSFTFNGTGGKDVTIEKEFILRHRFHTMRLFVARNGLELKQLHFKWLNENTDWE